MPCHHYSFFSFFGIIISVLAPSLLLGLLSSIFFFGFRTHLLALSDTTSHSHGNISHLLARPAISTSFKLTRLTTCLPTYLPTHLPACRPAQPTASRSFIYTRINDFDLFLFVFSCDSCFKKNDYFVDLVPACLNCLNCLPTCNCTHSRLTLFFSLLFHLFHLSSCCFASPSHFRLSSFVFRLSSFISSRVPVFHLVFFSFTLSLATCVSVTIFSCSYIHTTVLQSPSSSFTLRVFVSPAM